MKALDSMAERFLTAVEEEGIGGYREFGDRLDGKPAQQVQLSGDEDNPLVHKVVREVMKPSE